ncbi:PilZ domain-containing protein [Alkalihalophilus lindianensis]|uniref:PilZ domain-containing protein n=1 Tax=Alkalihalophilus lindianensis TaxID=1630542 RepID=A0ABU3X5R2_9BACI|nr:PilZ domain-containing protein [Alkalihalophilus lindianensis]MDV2683235.1 PilZ domain-containing protein [Alkalihalophilus lindianensis]
MQYKREESFRYEFNSPLNATFKLIKLATADVDSNEGKMLIIDISGGGLKMSSHLELPDPKTTKTSIEMDIELANETLEVQGEVVWKNSYNSSFQYGIDFTYTDKESQELITLLKKHIKQSKQPKEE